MKKSKKGLIFLIISILIVLISFLLHQYISLIKPKKNVIIMGTSADFPPFEYLKNGEIVGIDAEIAKHIAKKCNDSELVIKDVSFDSLILGLNQGDFNFIVSGFTKTEERAEQIGFSDSYFTASQKIVVKDSSSIKGLSDIKGKKIGVQIGSTGDSFCTDQKLGDIIRYDKFTEATTSLLKEMTDALVVDGFTAEQIVKNNKGLRIISKSLTEESYCIGFRKEDKELEKIINEVIAEMKQSGELDRIVDFYMNSQEDPSTQDVGTKFTNKEYWDYISKGLTVTLEITFFAMILGLLLGVLASILRIISKSNKKLSFLKLLVNFYSTVVRGTPVIVQLFIIYYIALSGISKNPILAAIITLGINSGAYVSEHIRSGINAIDIGQFEAGRSLGIAEKTLMSKVIIPQAIKNILPSLAGEGISLLKETAVVGFIGVMDLSLAGKKITSVTFEPVFPLFTVALIYLVLVIGLTFALNKVERKIKNAQN